MKKGKAWAAALLANELRSRGNHRVATSVSAGGMSRVAHAAVEAILAAAADPDTRSARDCLSAALQGRGLAILGELLDRPSGILAAALNVIEDIKDKAPRDLARFDLVVNQRDATTRIGTLMAGPKPTLTVKNESGVAQLEEAIRDLARAPRRDDFVLKMSGAPQKAFLREMWLSLVVGAALDAAPEVTLLAPGLSDWPDFERAGFDDDETAALSLSYLLGLQSGARILPEIDAEKQLDAHVVRRHASLRRGGLLGLGGKVRRLVEFDPEEPIASVLGRRDDRAAKLEQLILSMMAQFEVGAIARGLEPVAQGPKRHVIAFLRELHSNAYAYARHTPGVRMLGFRKHLYQSDVAIQRAEQFPALRRFVEAQGTGLLNLVEATVSDFGPGILGGFRKSEAALEYTDWDDDRLIRGLLHQQISGNLSDPNAGLGISIALEGASNIGGFVTLRTGAHWFVLDPTEGPGWEMQAVPGQHPTVRGTHWAVLYPDSPRV